ncbi:MAG TPA: TolC family protein [Myxococcales bacterium]|nr:TolC family protein [Myxococcales bacterium]
MLAALLSLVLAAPAPLRLADLLREAREKNPELKAAAARARASQSSVSPAGALDDPMLMVQLWNAPVDFSTVPVMLQLSQNVPLGGKRGARTDIARADAAMAEADLGQKQRDVETQVAAAYFELFLADRTQEIDDEVEAILGVVLRSAQARVSTGKAEHVELLRAQGALLQLRSERETAIDQRRSSWARLSALVDRDPAAPPGTTTRPGVLGALPDATALTERALRERPELAGTRAAIEGAQAQERLARANRIPDLGVFAAGMHTFNNPMGVSDFLFAGFQVNLPLFSGGKNEPRIAAAQAQLIASQEGERALRNRVVAEVAEHYAHVLAEMRQIDLHHQLIPIARQAVQSGQSSYAAGRSDFTMVLESARELRMHEMNEAMHLAAYEQRLAELQRAVGGDLGLARAAEADHEERH